MSEICSVPVPVNKMGRVKKNRLTEDGMKYVKAAKNEEAIKWEGN